MAKNSNSGKTNTTFIVVLIIAFWFAGLSVFLFVERQTLPLIYADIPKPIIDFLEEQFKKGSDFHIDYIDDPDPKEWLDNTNYGDADSSGFRSISDTSFIIYYNDNPEELVKARQMLQTANSAISSLAGLFGKYFYPSDVHNKKLPVYITNSLDQFVYLINRDGLPVTNSQASGYLGVTLMEFSVYGTKVKSILMSPEAWKYDSDNTLRHEMAHYVYFNQVKYDQADGMKLWVQEGIAEYYAKSIHRLKEADYSTISDFHLNQDMPNFNAYWVGFSIFTYMDKTFEYSRVKKFISETTIHNSDLAFVNSLGLTYTGVEPGWKDYVKELSLNK